MRMPRSVPCAATLLANLLRTPPEAYLPSTTAQWARSIVQVAMLASSVGRLTRRPSNVLARFQPDGAVAGIESTNRNAHKAALHVDAFDVYGDLSGDDFLAVERMCTHLGEPLIWMPWMSTF
jgi:hypothetical protein